MAKSSGSREIGNPGNETLVVRRCRQPSITVSKSREGRKTCYLVVTASSAAATCPPPSPSLSLSACAPPFINIETAAPREGVHERDTRHQRANEEALSPEHRALSPEPRASPHITLFIIQHHSFIINASACFPVLSRPHASQVRGTSLSSLLSTPAAPDGRDKVVETLLCRGREE
jgi:hypothetical protein